MSTLNRDFVADLEIRSDGDGRTVHGIVVPYGQTARVNDGRGPYQERFQQGAFRKTLTERKAPVYLLSQHKHDAPLGRATDMREEAGGLYGSFRVSKTRAGDEHLELVRDGVLGSFSVGFTPISEKRDGGVTVRTEVALREVSLVTFPSYDGALVAGIRAQLDASEQALAVQLLTALSASEAALDPIVEALCGAEGALDAAQGVIAQLLGIPDPDAADDAAEGETSEMADMQMSSSLTSLARRLDEAIAARGSTTSTPDAGTDEPHTHSGRLIIARNTLRAELTRRGIR